MAKCYVNRYALAVLTVLLCQSLSIIAAPEEKNVLCKPKNGKDLVHCTEYSQTGSVLLNPDNDYLIEKDMIVDRPSSLSINGQGATIKCNNSGLIFNTVHINIRNVTISSCGALHNSSSVNVLLNDTVVQFKAAVYIERSQGVLLNHVTIMNSHGVGLALINCFNTSINNGGFTNNGESTNKLIPGGGGVYIEHTILNETTYEIAHSIFSNNTASTGKYKLEDYPIYQSSNKHFLFGKGGGLSINLNATSVNINVHDCLFENNRAHRGGGLFIFFLTKSKNNSVSITCSNFTSNQCTVQKVPASVYSAGGGLAVIYLNNTPQNECYLRACNFAGNTAYYGGGISVGTNKGEHSSSFLIEDSTFENNSAKIGSAMDLFCYSIFVSHSCQCIVPEIRSTTFMNNNDTYANTNTIEMTFATIHLQDLKALFSGDISITDNGASGVGLENAIMDITSNASVLIQNNMAQVGGGIVVLGGSEIHVREGIQLIMRANTATERGGGIYVEQTERFFSIYSYTCFIRYYDYPLNGGKKHPDEWIVNIMFSNNFAHGKPNAIFASSIYPCVWPSTPSTIPSTVIASPTNNSSGDSYNISNTFCHWKSWTFEPNVDCSALIRTLPQIFSQNSYAVEVYPYKQQRIAHFSVFDDFQHDVTNGSLFTTRIVSPENSESCGPDLTSDGILVKYPSNKTFEVLVQTAYHRSISTKVKVTVQECPVGFKNNEGCKCIVPNISSVLQCDLASLSLVVFIGHCIGYGSIDKTNNRQLVISKCPFTADYLEPFVSVSNTTMYFNQEFCKKYYRSGVLCHQCITNYSINIFSSTYECMQCDYGYVNWIKAVSMVVGPQTLFFCFVVIFHIGITAPSMTGYIFFSHVVTLPLEIIVLESAWRLDMKQNSHHDPRKYSHILTDLVVDPYRIWSLDYPEIFREKVCLHESLKIMHAIAFRYISALYPIILLVMTLLLIELHARNCKPIVYLWKPLCFVCIRLRRKWEIKTSVIDAFATVILLSYSKIINTSLYLLTRNFVLDENGTKIQTRLDYDTSVVYLQGQHVIFAAVAVFVLCTFGTIPPLLLLLYPNRLFFRFLTKIKLDRWHGLHVFVETFQGSFKNRTNGSPERHWFAGIYFVFRIVVFLLFALTNDVIKIHLRLAVAYIIFLLFIVILKPYKKDLYTYLDASFMAILALMNCSIVYCATQVQTTKILPKNIWHLTYALLWVPTAYFTVYLLYLICTRSRSTFIQRYCVSNIRRLRNKTVTFFANQQDTHEQLLTDDDNYSIVSDGPTHSSLCSFSDAPDRVNNPHRYSNMEWSNRLEGMSFSVVSVDRDNPIDKKK